jgi:hypothetical protein
VKALALLAALIFAGAAVADDGRATARYAPAQLEMAHQSLERAREAALMGQLSLAGTLAWEASVDARLAWAMSDAPAIRGPAARVFHEASRLVRQMADRQSREALATAPVDRPAVR